MRDVIIVFNDLNKYRLFDQLFMQLISTTFEDPSICHILRRVRFQQRLVQDYSVFDRIPNIYIIGQLYTMRCTPHRFHSPPPQIHPQPKSTSQAHKQKRPYPAQLYTQPSSNYLDLFRLINFDDCSYSGAPPPCSLGPKCGLPCHGRIPPECVLSVYVVYGFIWIHYAFHI